MVHYSSMTLRFDGACQPNPGKGGGGYVISNDDENEKIIIEGYFPVRGKCTNNVAEYFGLYKGLNALKKSGHTVEQLNIQGDSELVINQMTGDYQVKQNRLKKIKMMTKARLYKGNYHKNHNFRHIERELNSAADELARRAVDKDEPWTKDYTNE